jgi:hypothetical protein
MSSAVLRADGVHLPGYSAVYQAMVVVLAGIILYAFIKARGRNPEGQS